MVGSSGEQINNAVEQASNINLKEFYIKTLKKIQELQKIKKPSQLASQENAMFSVYWSLDEKHFSQERTIRNQLTIDNNGRFETEYALNKTIRKIRFDFPASPDAKIEVEQLTIIQGGLEIPIDPLVAKYVLMHNISREGNSFRLHGSDPHFAIELKETAVDSVYFRGKIH